MTKAVSPVTLKHCPFCSGTKFQRNTKAKSHWDKKKAQREGRDDSNHLIRCTTCGAKGPLKHSVVEAEKAWNYRPSQTLNASLLGKAVVPDKDKRS